MITIVLPFIDTYLTVTQCSCSFNTSKQRNKLQQAVRPVMRPTHKPSHPVSGDFSSHPERPGDHDL